MTMKWLKTCKLKSPSLNHSITPLFHGSITPSLPCSITPTLHFYSTPPTFITAAQNNFRIYNNLRNYSGFLFHIIHSRTIHHISSICNCLDKGLRAAHLLHKDRLHSFNNILLHIDYVSLLRSFILFFIFFY